jgi:predicted HNH restriction endonuclease
MTPLRNSYGWRKLSPARALLYKSGQHPDMFTTEKNINEYVKRYAEYVLRDPEFYKKDEGYKYRAVATFQKYFDLSAKNFHAMLEQALSDSDNLIEAKQFYPREMILCASKRKPELVRKLLKELLDGRGNVYGRIDNFIRNFNEHHKKYKSSYAEYGEKTYFDYRFVSFLIAANKPKEYFYVKYAESKKFAEMIGYTLVISGTNGQRYKALYELAKIVRDVLKSNNEFRRVHQQITDPFEYKDPSFSWGTTDFIFNVVRRIGTTFHKETQGAVARNKKLEINKREELEDMLVEDEIVEAESQRSKEELTELVRKFKPSGKPAYLNKEGKHRVRLDSTTQKERIKRLEDYKCQICGFTFEFTTASGKKRKFVHADHIIEKSDGGTEEADNLWALCPNCHAKKTLEVISVDTNRGKISEYGKEIQLHHNNHLSWYKSSVGFAEDEIHR